MVCNAACVRYALSIGFDRYPTLDRLSIDVPDLHRNAATPQYEASCLDVLKLLKLFVYTIRAVMLTMPSPFTESRWL